jgi:hypothetical protein
MVFNSTVVNVQDDDDGFHVTATVDAPDGVDLAHLRVELPGGIRVNPDASSVSDIGTGTHSFGLSGSGKSPFKVGDQIPLTVYEK